MKRVLLAVLAVLISREAAAQSGWTRTHGGTQGAYLTAISAIDRSHVSIGGVHFDQAHLLTPYLRKVMSSDDGGHMFADVSGTLDDTGAHDGVDAIFRLDASTIWAASGTSLARTHDRGTTWSTATAGARLSAIHFFDAEHGVVAGENGALFTTADGGDSFQAITAQTNVDLRQLFFADRRHGWALGYHQRTEQTEMGNAVYEEDGAVLITDDGGDTWRAGATTSGVGLGPLFMTADGQHGYLAGWRRSDPFDLASDAILYKTSDGGASFTDMHLPLEVGTLHSGFGDRPLHASRFFAMYWDDALHGHLAGVAHLVSASSSMSNGMMSTSMQSASWRIVDYSTDDGGATWTKTDLGTITLQGLTPPPSDGTILAGTMIDLCTGWLAGDEETVYTFATSCASPSSDAGTGSHPDAAANPGNNNNNNGGGGSTRSRDEGCSCTEAPHAARGRDLSILLAVLTLAGARRAGPARRRR